jgi:carbon-monoxide dehydrogenase medium subunit
MMWQEYVNAETINQVLTLLNEKKTQARIIAGGTDLVLELHQGIHHPVQTLIDISRVRELCQITNEGEYLRLGAGVTHNQCLSDPAIREFAFPLAQASWEVGAPQIRNTGTVVGNLVTASPANDTIVPLYALDARLVIQSLSGKREVALKDFYTGVREHILQPDEMVTAVLIPKMSSNQGGTFLKLGLRKAQAISLVTIAVVITREKDLVSDAKITLGAVAPTIIHADKAEKFLIGKSLSEENIQKAAVLSEEAARPIDDIRSSAAYRQEITRILVKRGLEEIVSGEVESRLPKSPALLTGKDHKIAKIRSTNGPLSSGTSPIITRINGDEYIFEEGHRHSLLHLIREEAGLTGSKVGCEEGECGACTVYLDGKAVMACLVPAPRAHGAEIITIEGLGDDKHLHPVQETFVTEGAVQCGYCTPGFIMSAAKLLEEQPHPNHSQIKTAISGNLCRCTGYYKIIRAIEEASRKEGG